MTPLNPCQCLSKRSPTGTKPTLSTSPANVSASPEKKADSAKQVKVRCSQCGRTFLKTENRVRENNFCCGGHLRSWNSRRMSEYNRISNPMNRPGGVMESRLRRSRELRGKGEGKAYRKLLGRHEHRRLAEMNLGRQLKAGEVVHHLDGNKLNNDPANLAVLPSQSEHCKAHGFGKKKGR